MSDFRQQSKLRIEAMRSDERLHTDARALMNSSIAARYSYNFFWLGRPIIQYPQDMVAVQELIFRVRPDLVIETGIAHGGSLILSASMLALLDYCDALANGVVLDPMATERRVLGVDIEIRDHNRTAIESHPMAHRIDMLQGSSTSANVIAEVHKRAAGHQRIMVMLDSNHTHEHVLAELEAYAPLVSSGSYCIVFDTIIEDLPEGTYPDRPWEVGDNPKTAVREFLSRTDDFVVDDEMTKLLITAAPGGYLRRR